MSVTFKPYHDAALTSEITAGNPLTFSQASDGSTGPVIKAIYIGSTESSKKIEKTGGGQIVLSIVDAAPSSGHPATEVKLALSISGLSSAVGGASLNLGTQLTSGVANALPVYLQVEDTTATVGTSTELSLQTSNVTESAL